MPPNKPDSHTHDWIVVWWQTKSQTYTPNDTKPWHHSVVEDKKALRLYCPECKTYEDINHE